MQNYLNWGLSAIDTIFSTKSAGDAESYCPGSSSPAGYVKDSYGKWQQLCLSELSVEDAEDLVLFWLQVASTVVIGAATFLVYRKIKKTAAAQQNAQRMPDIIMDIGRCIQSMTGKLDVIIARLDAIQARRTA